MQERAGAVESQWRAFRQLEGRPLEIHVEAFPSKGYRIRGMRASDHAIGEILHGGRMAGVWRDAVPTVGLVCVTRRQANGSGRTCSPSLRCVVLLVQLHLAKLAYIERKGGAAR